MKLYSYHEAARLLELSGRAVIHKRIKSLEVRGEPLTVEAGEVVEVGKRLLLTDKGVERLRDFEPRKGGRKPTTED